MKTVEICCSKTSVNFGRCYGNQGWAETVENQMLFLNISSFEKSESFNSVAQGVLEILGRFCKPNRFDFRKDPRQGFDRAGSKYTRTCANRKFVLQTEN